MLYRGYVLTLNKCDNFFQVAAGAFVIREGDSGSHLYVSSEGEFEVIKDGKQVIKQKTYVNFPKCIFFGQQA